MKIRTMLKAIHKSGLTYRQMERVLKMQKSSISNVINGKQPDVMHSTYNRVKKYYDKEVMK